MNVTDDVRHHHSRCAQDRARLQMLASDPGGAPFPPGGVRQVVQATSAVLAEAREGARTALTAGPGSRRPSGRRSFLAARLARLENAAHEAIASARDGDTTALRQRLRRFDTLTSAMWTVQLAVCEQGGPRRPAGRPLTTWTARPGGPGR